MNERNRQRSPDHHNPPQRSERDELTHEQIQAILKHGPQEIDTAAQKLAKQCQELKRTQMRNFYGPIVRLRSELAGDPSASLGSSHARALMMHRARLAYMAARPDGRPARPLQACFSALIDAAVRNNGIDADKVRAICDFAEAVVAYHYSTSKQGES